MAPNAERARVGVGRRGECACELLLCVTISQSLPKIYMLITKNANSSEDVDPAIFSTGKTSASHPVIMMTVK